MSDLHATSTTMDKIIEGKATEQHFTVVFALPRHCLALVQPAGFALRDFHPNSTIEDWVKVKVEDCNQNFQEEETLVATNVHL
jgi:hypothetical protein